MKKHLIICAAFLCLSVFAAAQTKITTSPFYNNTRFERSRECFIPTNRLPNNKYSLLETSHSARMGFKFEPGLRKTGSTPGLLMPADFPAFRAASYNYGIFLLHKQG